MGELKQSEFNDILKRMSKVSLRVIITGIGLKYKYEHILWLIYIDELSYAEIAEELNLTRESVGNLASKARKQFKYLVDEQDILLPDEVKKYLNMFKVDDN